MFRLPICPPKVQSNDFLNPACSSDSLCQIFFWLHYTAATRTVTLHPMATRKFLPIIPRLFLKLVAKASHYIYAHFAFDCSPNAADFQLHALFQKRVFWIPALPSDQPSSFWDFETSIKSFSLKYLRQCSWTSFSIKVSACFWDCSQCCSSDGTLNPLFIYLFVKTCFSDFKDKVFDNQKKFSTDCLPRSIYS